MEDVIFEIWDNKLRKTCDVLSIDFLNETAIVVTDESRATQNEVKKKDYILRQYIGLSDINGIKIYEGDIVSTTDDGSLFVVIYCKKRASFILSEMNQETGFYERYDDESFFVFNLDGFHNTLSNNEVEVVGNIHTREKHAN